MILVVPVALDETLRLDRSDPTPWEKMPVTDEESSMITLDLRVRVVFRENFLEESSDFTEILSLEAAAAILAWDASARRSVPTFGWKRDRGGITTRACVSSDLVHIILFV